MDRRSLIKSAGIAGVLAAGVAPAVHAQAAVRWRLASSFPKSLDTIFGSAETFARTVKELSGGKIEWTDGMLYPVLHWLEDQDLVRSRWTKSESGRKRKYYSLQPDGRQALRHQKEQWTLVTSTLNQLWRPQHA